LSAVSAGWLGRFSGYHPFIVTAMGSDINLLETRSTLFRALTISTLRNADYVICVSNELSNKVLSYGISPKRCEVVYLGVDLNVFHPEEDKHIVRAKLDLNNSPMVLSIRAMNWIYNPLDIANTIPNVLSQHPQTQFVIFTYNQDEELFSQFKYIIDRIGVGHAVTYISHLDDDNALADYYRAVDVAVSVPISDGTPISVLECLACGTPVVLSDLPSLHDWVQNEKECLFVPTGDVQAISDAIVRLLDNTTFLKNMGYRAVSTIKKRADQKLLMKRSEDIYQQLVGNISS
jgi:glycosyltransferase involved in cell wall biosynthesis